MHPSFVFIYLFIFFANFHKTMCWIQCDWSQKHFFFTNSNLLSKVGLKNTPHFSSQCLAVYQDISQINNITSLASLYEITALTVAKSQENGDIALKCKVFCSVVKPKKPQKPCIWHKDIQKCIQIVIILLVNPDNKIINNSRHYLVVNSVWCYYCCKSNWRFIWLEK